MSIAKQHAEWLSLLEISGPFLSLSELQRVFPQGLDTIDSTRAAELRAAYEEWQQEQADLRIHRAWVNYVLGTILGWESRILAEGQAIPERLKYAAQEHGGETVRPTLILHAPDRPDQPRMLVLVCASGQDLERAIPKSLWAASPAARMLSLLRQTGVRLGLVSNGEQWMLVSAPPDGAAGYISWYAELWHEERLTLRAFTSLLGAQRFFGTAPEDSLETMLTTSASDVQEVTDQLGSQVRHAVEILVRALDRGDQERGGALLASLDEARLYEAALTVMMRLVFLLSAEERGLFLLGDPLYDQNYAISTLRAQLHEAADHAGEEVLERRFDAWSRLLATFRMVYAGSAHEDLQLPAYGGSLFDPDRFPFLEGRPEGSYWEESPANPPPITNRAVLHLLDALQVLQGKGEARRLSFRALDIEQIGHVYEGLLDHEACRAAEPILGLSGRNEPEVALSKLEQTPDSNKLSLLKEATGRAEPTLRRALNAPPDGDRLRRLVTACEGDQNLVERVMPYLNLLRDDELGYPVLILTGHVFVTAGTERRATGTHYTPKALTEPIVEHTLEPIVYRGVAEGLPPEQWQLISPQELLALKVCDMAMGSGAFLVQACRYLGARLVEAWERALTLAQTTSPLAPLHQVERGMVERGRIEIPGELMRKMYEVAREFRKEPTRSEERLWDALRGRQIEGLKFRRQQAIGPFVVDFYCPSQRLIVEVDGAIHASQQDADGVRQELIEAAGYRFVRLSAELVERDLSEALRRIREAVAGTTSSPRREETSSPRPPSPSSGEGGEEAEFERGDHTPPSLDLDEEPSSPIPPDFLPSPLDGEGLGVRSHSEVRAPTPRLTIYGEVPTGALTETLIPDDPDERLTLAKRLIAERCLYGVDKNPLAVEMAKLSLWLTTLAKGRPFTFLDHALKCGDSLVGVSLEQLTRWSLDTRAPATLDYFGQSLITDINKVISLRREIEAHPAHTVDDLARKGALLAKAEAISHDLRAAADALILSYLNSLPTPDRARLRKSLLDAHLNGQDVPETFRGMSLNGLRPFHWELEFPEVFLGTSSPALLHQVEKGAKRASGFPSPLDGEGLGVRSPGVRAGFHAFIGNPPFQGGQHLTGAHGVPYRDYLVNTLAGGQKGSADLCAYFFLRAYHHLRQGGTMGLIATNTIAQGDTREVGLDALVRGGGTIYHALNDQPWIGAAAVVVNVIHLHKGTYSGEKRLDGRGVAYISALLDDSEGVHNPHRLLANGDKSYIGSYVLGMGFVLEPDEAAALIAKDPRNREVLFPYLNGEDLNSHPEQQPSRWVINFFDWSEAQAQSYPDCYAIVREKVYPERTRLKADGQFQLRYPLPQKWWIYGEKRPALYRTIAPLSRVLVVARVSKFLNVSFCPKGIVYSDATSVIASKSGGMFAVLQSNFHELWTRQYASTLESRLRYTPSDAFETFPFPESLTSLESIGEQYHETRRQIMLQRQEGLTATYNRFHHPGEKSADIQALRELHVEMDQAVAAAYGWDDLALGHGFHETKQGLRFTLQESARREVLRRLLALNLARYEAETSTPQPPSPSSGEGGARPRGAGGEGGGKSRGKGAKRGHGGIGQKVTNASPDPASLPSATSASPDPSSLPSPLDGEGSGVRSSEEPPDQLGFFDDEDPHQKRLF